jgi:hypothetical protein
LDPAHNFGQSASSFEVHPIDVASQLTLGVLPQLALTKSEAVVVELVAKNGRVADGSTG